MRGISHIVIHCSGSPNGRDVLAADIDRWHQARGFQRKAEWLARQQAWLPHIGYHFVIEQQGLITGRHLDEIGAHVQGSNARSIGICMVGTDRFHKSQWQELRILVGRLQARYPAAKVCGHRDFSPDLDGDGVIERNEWIKDCPGFDVAAWMAAGMRPTPDQLIEMKTRT